MAAATTPEVIVPGELYIPDGKVGYSVEAASTLNGNGSLLITEAAGTENFQAYQDQHANHLLESTACSLSFWIRRNTDFDGQGSVSTYTNSALASNVRYIMGVADPLGVATGPADRTISWAIIGNGGSAFQFVQNGYWTAAGQYYWSASSGITLNLNQWHLIVVNRDPCNVASSVIVPDSQGWSQVYRDGNYMSGTGQSAWTFYPNPVNPHRFGIGDQTTLGRTQGGLTAVPAFNLYQVAFHSRKLTNVDMLTMIDSMRYGAA